MRRRKVLFQAYNLAAGGVERFLSGLVHYVKEAGVDPVCLFYSRESFYTLPPRTRTCFIRPHVDIYIQLAKLIKTEKPDVICGFLDSLDIIPASLASEHPHRLVISVPAVVSASISIIKSGWGERPRHWVRELYPRADAIIAVSEGVKQDLVENFHIRPSKIQVVYNGINRKRVQELSKEKVHDRLWAQKNIPVIVSVGSLTPVKNHSHLLKAFKLVRKRLDCRLALIGEGKLESKLRDEAGKLGVLNDVIFLGLQKNPFKFMARSSLFVLPSLSEGLPLVLLEAMTCGVPVISTDCPTGPGEVIVNNKNGLLVPPRDVKALADAMFFMLTQRKKAEKMANAAEKTVEKFELKNSCEQYMRIFFPD